MNADRKLPEGELTERIIGVFFAVYNELGYGFLETVYENAMCHALRESGIEVSRQVPFAVEFHGHIVGDYRADLIADQRVILEIKAIPALGQAQEAQLLNYLKVSQIEVGLLLNFGPKAEFKRKVLSAKNPRSSAISA
ncbi:GxxExxY protein [Azonexus sp.]|uniref:GxxExxY protein n=1 Tax=Azonexus sp. TaxID=1872668 RepID=UPI0039E22B5D